MNYGKLLKIELPFQPNQCCGIEVALGIGALAVGVGGAIAGSASQSKINQEQIDFAREENEKNRSFSSEESEKQRDWQHDEWLNQYERQSSDWYKQLAAQEGSQKRMFDYEAEYNLPANQVRRMQSAGLNPAAVLGGQGSSPMVSASSGNYANLATSVPSGGAVSGSAASAPSSLQPNLKAPIFDIGSLGSFLSDFAKAYKDNRMLRPELDKVAAQIGYTLSQTAGQDLSNAYASLELFIKQKTKDTEIYQKFLDLGVTYNEMALKGALSDESSQKALLAKEEAMLARMKKKLTKEQYNQALFYTQHLNETYQMEMEVKRSAAASNYAAAANQNALAKTENEIRDWKVAHEEQLFKVEQCLAGIQKNKLFVSEETLEEQVSAFAAQLKREHILTDTAQQELEIAIKNNDWYVVKNLLNPIFGTLNQTTRTGMDVFRFTE